MTSTDNSSDVQNQQQQQQHLQQKQQQQPRIELDKPSQSSGDSEKTQTKPSRPKRKKPGFHDDMFQETSYYFKNGLRFVYPYAFTFTAHIKKRWLGLQVLELFQREFHMESVQYYENAIKIGKIRVNDRIVDKSRVLTSRDILKTTVHRHEPPVVNETIEFLQNDDDMVVINKPPSIPVHPCGRYRHNTVVFILGKEHELQRLHTIHRIDRLTSGILMFAKTPEKAKEMEEAVHGRNVEKEYLARVVGDFPSDEVTVKEPLLTMSHKIGVCQVHAEGKPCSTLFKKLSFNGKSSVVKCRPFTGRMHQIRVHLQWLGHPIVNDPIYNHKTAWGDGKGKCGTRIDVEKVVAELIRTRKDKSYDNDDNFDTDINTPTNSTDMSATNPTVDETDAEECPSKKKLKVDIEEESEDNDVTYTSLDLGKEYFDSSCTECKRSWKEPSKGELVMYLHALKYKGPGWEYKTSAPDWSADTWNVD